MTVEWLSNNQLKVDAPKRPKKITGTRFAAILGLNPWSTPFEAWCAITRTYEKPFEDTKSTIAGKTIEPKQAEYMRKNYLMELVSPTDMYGKDYFKTTKGDFFKEDPVFGGMWDYLMLDDAGQDVAAVLEMKTTKRSEDWLEGPPEYYAMQAALYAYLLKLDDVIMVCSFLTDDDLNHPDDYVCTADNTVTFEFRVSERYPDMGTIINDLRAWWDAHVVTGVSPEYDVEKDKEILDTLYVKKPDADITDIIKEAEDLKVKLNAHYKEVAADEKRLKELEGAIKTRMVNDIGQAPKATMKGNKFQWTVSVSHTEKLDEKELAKVINIRPYMKPVTKYTLTSKEV